MASFFGQRGTQTDPTPPATGLRIQSSVQGKVIPVGWGQGRVSGNLIWYGDFLATPHLSEGGGGGGKGAGGGGGGKGSSGSITYTYSAAFIMAICEGPVRDILGVWNNKSFQALAALNLTALPGSYSQGPWGYMSSLHPAEARPYRGIGAIGAGPMDMGDSTELPNLNFEVKFGIADAAPGIPDAQPIDVITDALTSAHYGGGYPAAALGASTAYRSYCLAAGLLVSPIITDQQELSQLLSDLLEATNSEAVNSNGLLQFIPRGDQDISGNGAIYIAPTQPEYDIDESSLLPPDDSSISSPVSITRPPQQDCPNVVPVEYMGRSNSYNPVTLDASDDGSIASFGERPAALYTWHFFALDAAASMAAQLMLGKLQNASVVSFKLPPRYVRLDPMDIVALTREAQGLFRQWVRITEIEENDDFTLSITAEIYLNGTGAAPEYGTQTQAGHTPDYMVDPGSINTPILFEPTDQLAGALEVWGAISGQDLALWGGANVYVSSDNETFALAGRVLGAARAGVLTAPLAAAVENPTGATIDTTSAINVDLSQSGGALIGGTLTDVLSLNTVCYVGGEFVAYRDAELTGLNNYNLTYLVRGAYGTEALMAEKPVGTPFARLDGGIIKIPFDQSRIGSTIYIKFCSFNLWGAGTQELSDVSAHAYVITGSALAAPLPDITNLRDTFVDGVLSLAWDTTIDFRGPVSYEVRLGESPASAVSLGVVGTPKFPVPGDGRYWVSAIAQPVAGLWVRSENWVSRTVEGTLLVKNVIARVDEKATGWPGIFSGGAGISGPYIATGGAGNLLTETDFLGVGDVLSFGGNISGFYESPSAHWVNVGRVAACPVKISYIGTGVPVGQDILSTTDILGLPDFLGASSTQFTDVYPMISVAQSDTMDLYAIDPNDLYYWDNLYAAGLPWGPWQKYEPGAYQGKWIKWGMSLNTVDPQTQAICQAFAVEVDVPDRTDTSGLILGALTPLTNLAVGTGGVTIVFAPNGSATAAAFNGSPDGTVGGLPGIQVTCGGLQTGDNLVITGLTASQVTVAYQNSSGTPVSRSGVNIYIQGF